MLVTATEYVIGVDGSIGATAFQFNVMPVAVKLLLVVMLTTVGVAVVVVTEITFEAGLAPIALVAMMRIEYAVDG